MFYKTVFYVTGPTAHWVQWAMLTVRVGGLDSQIQTANTQWQIVVSYAG